MGKPKHSNDHRGEQKGAQQHAEGQHGPKAHQAKLAELSDHSDTRQLSGRAENDPGHPANDGGEAKRHERLMAHPEVNADGGHRLFENRKQHDEAEKNSEKTRVMRDIDRHGHDPEQFQIPGGRASHPAAPQDPDAPIIRSGGQGGSGR